MRRLSNIFVYVLAVALFTAACGRQNNESTVTTKNIVRINGKTYTSQDIWDFANITLWEMEPKDLASTTVKNKILEDFIDHRLLFEEADKRGITDYYNNQTNQLYNQLTTEQGAKELKAVTGQYDIDAAKMARLSNERLVIDELNHLIVTNMGYITEDEIKKYYESKVLERNPVGVAHILQIFTTDPSKAQTAAKELASGIIFSEVARKYSEAPEKDNGGDLGFIVESAYPEFFKEAFKLKEGEISPVIQSEYGYHIFKMVQYANAGHYSYDKLKQQLFNELYVIKRQEMVREFVNALRSNADIQYLNDFTLDELFPGKVQR